MALAGPGRIAVPVVFPPFAAPDYKRSIHAGCRSSTGPDLASDYKLVSSLKAGPAPRGGARKGFLCCYVVVLAHN